MKVNESQSHSIKILYLEDSLKDFELMRELLSLSDLDFELMWAEDEQDFLLQLKANHYDLILSDYNLPKYNAFSALKQVQEICPNVPFIVVSGAIGEESAIELIKQGAIDYLLKDNKRKFSLAIKRAINEAKEKENRKKAENEIKENEIKYRTLTENLPDIVFQFDTNLKYTYVNPIAESVFGIHPDKFIGKTIDEIGIPENNKQQWYENLEALLIELELKTFESNIPTLMGDRFFLIKAVPVYNPNKEIFSILTVARDITEQKENEKLLIKAKEKAEESDRLKTSFIHNISHEIRTPLNAIVGFTSLLSHKLINEEKFKEYKKIITQSSEQLCSIINDIFNIANIDAGLISVKSEEFNINQILTLVYNQYKIKAEEKGVSLLLELGLIDTEASLVSDKIKLSQVISNLVGNALKFTPKGSISFGYTFENSQILFYVKDTGIGIPQEMHEEIFKRFRQVEITENRTYGGTGLGLSISKAYIELLGGSIWLSSEMEKGSSFYFTIPYTKPLKEERILKPTEIVQVPIQKSKTILIVEDDTHNYIMLKEMLSDLNFSILRADNGLDAVSICSDTNDIDLVLMDIKMPVMDGFEATQRIKKIKPGIPIIAQTAFSFETDIHQAYQSGCDDVICKPFIVDQLLKKISEYLK